DLLLLHLSGTLFLPALNLGLEVFELLPHLPRLLTGRVTVRLHGVESLLARVAQGLCALGLHFFTLLVVGSRLAGNTFLIAPIVRAATLNRGGHEAERGAVEHAVIHDSPCERLARHP